MEGTALRVVLGPPHLWLALEAGLGVTRGIASVDDLEVDFAEREAVRLADAAHVTRPALFRWCRNRGWVFPLRTTVASAPLPTPPSPSSSPSPSPWGESDGGLVVVIQGPGGGRQGAMVSSGGDEQGNGFFKVAKGHRFDAMEDDVRRLAALLSALAPRLSPTRTPTNAGGIIENERAREVHVIVAGADARALPVRLLDAIAGAGAGTGMRVRTTACSYAQALGLLEKEEGEGEGGGEGEGEGARPGGA